jgi:putative FmdB family regulatory protein
LRSWGIAQVGSTPTTSQDRKLLNGGAMPFYEFTCDCGHIAEVFFEMNDEKRIICEGCKKKLMQRKYSLGGTIFKGEGWGGK